MESLSIRWRGGGLVLQYRQHLCPWKPQRWSFSFLSLSHHQEEELIHSPVQQKDPKSPIMKSFSPTK
jgi:hypothetical protein